MLDTSTQIAAQETFSSYYTIAGRVLRIEARTQWEGQWVDSFLSGFHLQRTAAAGVTAAAVTLKVARATIPAIPPALETFAINHGVCATDGSRYFLSIDESLVVISEPAARVVQVWFGTTSHARHPVAQVNVFSYGLQAALRRAGIYDLHAAGVRDPDSGRGALFVGASGSGKTTLTLRLAECGWQYLSDDMVVLQETAMGLEALGFRRLFAVPEASVAASRLPQLAEALGTPVASDPTKRRLEPEAVFPAGWIRRCFPRTLFFPQVTSSAKTSVTPLAARGAMEQLMRCCPWATYDAQAAPDYLRVLARLTNQCRSYALHAGSDLLVEPTLAAQLLAPYVSE